MTTLEATITCPRCGAAFKEKMPTDAADISTVAGHAGPY